MLSKEGNLDFYFFADNSLLRSKDRYKVYGIGETTFDGVRFSSSFPLYDELCIYEFKENYENHCKGLNKCINMCGDIYLPSKHTILTITFTIRVIGHKETSEFELNRMI